MLPMRTGLMDNRLEAGQHLPAALTVPELIRVFAPRGSCDGKTIGEKPQQAVA
jgi:hypothetical protein